MKRKILLILLFSMVLNAKSSTWEMLRVISSSSQTIMNMSISLDAMTRKKDFIKANYVQIQIDIANGDGEHLDTLASFYNIKDIPAWKAYLQKNYTSIFKET